MKPINRFSTRIIKINYRWINNAIICANKRHHQCNLIQFAFFYGFFLRWEKKIIMLSVIANWFIIGKYFNYSCGKYAIFECGRLCVSECVSCCTRICTLFRIYNIIKRLSPNFENEKPQCETFHTHTIAHTQPSTRPNKPTETKTIHASVKWSIFVCGVAWLLFYGIFQCDFNCFLFLFFVSFFVNELALGFAQLIFRICKVYKNSYLRNSIAIWQLKKNENDLLIYSWVVLSILHFF